MSTRGASPSAFASILRSSKFASYDPKVAQIYTTYAGHAYRGNWGLKRPLALKRKSGAFIVLRSIDSFEQQTEWFSAEKEAKWLVTAAELGREADVREQHPWHNTLGGIWQKTFDSDYNLDRAIHSCFGPNILSDTPQSNSPDSSAKHWLSTDFNRFHSAHSLNPSALNAKHFSLYIENLRRARPRFKVVVNREIQAKQNSHPQQRTLNLLNIAYTRTYIVTRFLKDEASRNFVEIGSRNILPSPHHTAAWSYSHTSDLTSKILHTPVQGRILSFAPKRGTTEKSSMVAGVAGMVGRLTNEDSGGQEPMELTNREGHDIPVNFRPKSVLLMRAPRVVNAPLEDTGFNSCHVSLDLVADSKLMSFKTNPYKPGSQQYVAHYDPEGQSARRRGANKPMLPQSQLRASKRLGKRSAKPLAKYRYVDAITDMLFNANKAKGNMDL